jgi:hypothetical protein
MRRDGTHRRKLLRAKPLNFETGAAFSPDGRRIVFSGSAILDSVGEAQRDGIWTVPVRGGHRRLIFANDWQVADDRYSAEPRSLSWQPR